MQTPKYIIVNGQKYKLTVDAIRCKDCVYFKRFKDASGYGICQSKHTFDGAFRDTDYCSYAKEKSKDAK